MKAYLVEQFGDLKNLKLKDGLKPLTPPPGHVIINVHACGVNFPDYLIVLGKYQLKPPLPFAPGGEVAGTIKSVGSGVTRFKEGDRVVGFCGYGGFATEVAVKEANVYHISDGMDFVTAASLLIAYMTSFYALRVRANLQPGETLLVLGAAGGCGLAAVQIGKAMGANVIAASSSEEKRRTCLDVGGTDHAIIYGEGPGLSSLKRSVEYLTNGAGANVLFDVVGGEMSEVAFRCLAPYGRHLVVGFAAGPVPKLPLNLVLLKQAQVIGVFMGQWAEKSPDEFRELLNSLTEWVKEGTVRPFISGVYPLERLRDALEAMASRRVQGKLVITTGIQENSNSLGSQQSKL